MPDFNDQPKVDFAIFKNSYKTTDKHPVKNGKIEFTREFLKAMVERAKTGEMPVLRVAIWDRVSKGGVPYENARLDLARSERGTQEDTEDDGLPF
tara:strand:- start:81 stop:365 length:285 start_codon:yes stop_codon:yes gene_type:complete